MKYLLMITLHCLCATAMAIDYTGNQLVAVLGKPVYSPEFQQYKNFWLLDNRFENPGGGIKVVINPNTLIVDTILVAGYDYAPSYSNCQSRLPYNIQLNDNASAISQKTGVAPTHYGTNIGYDVHDYQIMVKYNNSSNINCMRFFNPNAKPYSATPKLTVPEGATKMDAARINFENSAYTTTEYKANNHVAATAAPVAVNHVSEAAKTTVAAPAVSHANDVPKTAAASPVNDKLESARRALENSTFNHNTPVKVSAPVASTSVAKTSSTPATASAPRTTTSTAITNTTPKPSTSTTTTVTKSYTFKTGILGVFHAFRESGFYGIKHTQRSSGNVWNYKYTYATKLRIPGEQYNMLYSFPFEHSQMDFVSVLKESDSFDGFEAAYKQFEAKLMAEFPKSEGWIGTCLPNYDKSKISDFEMRNDKYGSIILDYCKTPKGKHILYLRFLLYS